MVRLTWIPLYTRENFPGRTSTGTSLEGLGTTCRRKRRKPLPKLSWTSPHVEWRKAASNGREAVFENHGVDALVFPYLPTFAQPIKNPVYTIDEPLAR